jgi:hypothetical protein
MVVRRLVVPLPPTWSPVRSLTKPRESGAGGSFNELLPNNQRIQCAPGRSSRQRRAILAGLVHGL